MRKLIREIYNTKIGDVISTDYGSFERLGEEANAFKIANNYLYGETFSKVKLLAVAESKGISTEPNKPYYLAFFTGGLNGSNEDDKWCRYLSDIQDIVLNIENCWVVELQNDCPDDVWYLIIGFEIK